MVVGILDTFSTAIVQIVLGERPPIFFMDKLSRARSVFRRIQSHFKFRCLYPCTT